MNGTIAIIGQGKLADLVSEALSVSNRIIRKRDLPRSGFPKSAAVGLAIHEEYRPSAQEETARALRNAGMPCLSMTVLFDEGIAGPWVRPGVPGCPQCAVKRRLAAAQDREKWLELRMKLWRHGVVPRDREVSEWGLRQMCAFIVAETVQALRGEPVRTDGRMYLADLKTLEGSLHVFLPDPLCPICGDLPADTAESAQIALKPSPKTDIRSYRCKPLNELAPRLLQDYGDERTGLMSVQRAEPSAPFCDVLVRLPSVLGEEVAAGRAHAYPQSLAAAILEGLERNCGIMPRGKRTTVRDCYRNLAPNALNPRDVGLYAPEQYALPDFPYEPFDEDTPLNWVWGYSFARERPILVPESLAYYSSAVGGGLANEGSNGCALGGSFEEAILHGALEVVERDSFLMAWYARLPVPRLDVGTAGDRELRLMAERLEAVSGYELFLYNTTTENGIPSIWALAKNKNRAGANLICAAGAHLDPVRAAKSAIFELAAHTRYLSEQYRAHRGEYLQMLLDPYRVGEMPDHSFLYTLPEAEERLRFLWHPDRPARKFADEFEARAPSPDLTDDLRAVIETFRRLNLDVIVVDQTSPEIARNGLFCVKVIIPGLLPMTFGHHLRRVSGLDRVLKVPMALGYTDRTLTPDELNPFPHPFL